MVRFEGWGGRGGQALRLTELGGDGILAETRLGSKKNRTIYHRGRQNKDE